MPTEMSIPRVRLGRQLPGTRRVPFICETVAAGHLPGDDARTGECGGGIVEAPG